MSVGGVAPNYEELILDASWQTFDAQQAKTLTA
jgi:hypothetical protein